MGRSSTMTRVAAIVAAVCLSLLCVGCQNSSTPVDTDAMVEAAVAQSGVDVKDVAAVVQGRIITQQQVDDVIAAERLRYGYVDDADWDRYLRSSGTTEWDVRASTIHHLIDQQLIEIEADRLGIDLGDVVDQRMASLEALYPSRAAFVEAVENRGYTIEEYTDAVRQGLLRDALVEAVVATPKPSVDQISRYAVVVAPTLEGRRSAHILFSATDYATAYDVYLQLQSGADFVELAALYSIDASATQGGDMGWDCLNTFVAPYQTALDGLEPGEVSAPILTRFGYHIIMCTDRYQAVLDESGAIDLDAIPQDLMQIIVDSMNESLTSQLFDHYIANLEAVTPIAVFNEQGEQVLIEEVGLATEVVKDEPNVDEVVAGIIDDARTQALAAVDEALAAFRTTYHAAQETSLPDVAVDQAIENYGVDPHAE